MWLSSLHTDPCSLLLSSVSSRPWDGHGGDPGSTSGVQTKFWKLLLVGSLLFWSYPRKPHLLFALIFCETRTPTLTVQGASCGFSEHLTAASLEYWKDYTLTCGVAGAAGKSVTFWVFPQLKWHWLPLTSSLGWMKAPERSSRCEGEYRTSGILNGTLTSPALQHSILKESRTEVSLWGRESCHQGSKSWGQYQSLACLGTLALIRILYRIWSEKSNKE